MAATRTIVVLGGTGMLGTSLGRVMDEFPNIRHVNLSHGEADVTESRSIENAIAKYEAQIVVNCAAMTDVDGCDRDPMLADAVNAEGARTVAQACHRANVLLVHLSTDFVFDGGSKRPYVESDPTAPISVYGSTKLEGERFVQIESTKHLIVRTAWTFGPGRDNFVTKVLDRARKEGTVSVVREQTGSPTYTVDLARGMLALMFTNAHGLYHIANGGVASRIELAQETLKLAGLEQVPVTPIESAEATSTGLVARRPAFSALDTSRFIDKSGFELPHWREALAEYVESLA